MDQCSGIKLLLFCFCNNFVLISSLVSVTFNPSFTYAECWMPENLDGDRSFHAACRDMEKLARYRKLKRLVCFYFRFFSARCLQVTSSFLAFLHLDSFPCCLFLCKVFIIPKIFLMSIIPFLTHHGVPNFWKFKISWTYWMIHLISNIDKVVPACMRIPVLGGYLILLITAKELLIPIISKH